MQFAPWAPNCSVHGLLWKSFHSWIDHFLAPDGFANLDTLTNGGIQYAETTLSTGKRLILIADNGPYQDAVDYCNQVGGEMLLTISEEENNEAGDFITANRDILASEKVAWLRARNPNTPTQTDGSEWIDPLTNQVIPYNNLVGGNNNPVAFLRKFSQQKIYKLLTFYV